jgi:hypothetical protein
LLAGESDLQGYLTATSLSKPAILPDATSYRIHIVIAKGCFEESDSVAFPEHVQVMYSAAGGSGGESNQKKDSLSRCT